MKENWILILTDIMQPDYESLIIRQFNAKFNQNSVFQSLQRSGKGTQNNTQVGRMALEGIKTMTIGGGNGDEGKKSRLNDNDLLTEEIILSKQWMLHYSPLRHKRKIVFKKGGSIGEGRNDWEYSWKFIKPGVFATFTKSNDPDVIFANAVKGSNGKWYLAGGAHTITQV